MTTSPFDAEEVAGRRRWPIWAVLLGLAVLSAAAFASYALFFPPRDKPADKSPAPKAAVIAEGENVPSKLRALGRAEQLAKAGTAVFGEPNGASIKVETGDDYGDGGGFDEMVDYRPGELVWAASGPILLSEGEVVDAAHVSAGKIAAHYLREEGDRLYVDNAYPKAVVTGSFGKVGQWSVSDQFLPAPVIYTQGGGTWQGYSCSWGILTELAPDGPRQVARFPLFYSNKGAMGDAGRTLEGKVANVVNGQSFDIVYSGARSFSERYVFSNGRFSRQGGESQMESC